MVSVKPFPITGHMIWVPWVPEVPSSMVPVLMIKKYKLILAQKTMNKIAQSLNLELN